MILETCFYTILEQRDGLVKLIKINHVETLGKAAQPQELYGYGFG